MEKVYRNGPFKRNMYRFIRWVTFRKLYEFTARNTTICSNIHLYIIMVLAVMLTIPSTSKRLFISRFLTGGFLHFVVVACLENMKSFQLQSNAVSFSSEVCALLLKKKSVPTRTCLPFDLSA